METQRLIFIQPTCRELVLDEFPTLAEHERDDIESPYTLVVIHDSLDNTFVDRCGRLWIRTEHIQSALSKLDRYFTTLKLGSSLKEAHEMLLLSLTGELRHGRKEKNYKEENKKES